MSVSLSRRNCTLKKKPHLVDSTIYTYVKVVRENSLVFHCLKHLLNICIIEAGALKKSEINTPKEGLIGDKFAKKLVLIYVIVFFLREFGTFELLAVFTLMLVKCFYCENYIIFERFPLISFTLERSGWAGWFQETRVRLHADFFTKKKITPMLERVTSYAKSSPCRDFPYKLYFRMIK